MSSLLSHLCQKIILKKYVQVLDKTKLFPQNKVFYLLLFKFYVIQVLVLLPIWVFYVCCTAGTSISGSSAERLYRFAIVQLCYFPLIIISFHVSVSQSILLTLFGLLYGPFVFGFFFLYFELAYMNIYWLISIYISYSVRLHESFQHLAFLLELNVSLLNASIIVNVLF